MLTATRNLEAELRQLRAASSGTTPFIKTGTHSSNPKDDYLSQPVAFCTSEPAQHLHHSIRLPYGTIAHRADSEAMNDSQLQLMA